MQLNAVMATTGHLWRNEAGQDLVEYALLGGLIGVAATTSLVGYVSAIKSMFTNIGNDILSQL